MHALPRTTRATTLRFVLLLCTLLFGTALAPSLWAAAPAQEETPATLEAYTEALFQIRRLSLFTKQAEVAYEDIANRRFAHMVNSHNVVFSDPSEDNGTIVLLLLLDDDVTTAAEWRSLAEDFLDAFFGGEFSDAELITDGTTDFVAEMQTRTDLFTVKMRMEEVAGAVAVIVNFADNTFWDAHEALLDESMQSFQWRPDQVQQTLAIQEEVSPLVRYTDERGVFSLEVPETFQPIDTDTPDSGYGTALVDQGQSQFLAVLVGDASSALGTETEQAPFTPITDAEWDAFIQPLQEDFGTNGELFWSESSPRHHTAYIGAGDLSSGEQARFWIEESDGVVLVVAQFMLDEFQPIARSSPLFERMIASLSWSPSTAEAVIRELHDNEATPPPVPFDDPFHLIRFDAPAFHPFDAAYFDGESLRYRFAGTPEDGGFFISFDRVAEETLDPETWAALVEDSQQVALDLVRVEKGTEPELVDREVSDPEAGENWAAFLARSDAWYGGMFLHEQEGLLQTSIALVPPDVWQMHEGTLNALLKLGVDYDPADILDFIDTRRAAGIALEETTLARGLEATGQPRGADHTFPGDGEIVFANRFANTDLSGQLDLFLWEPDAESPFAQIDLSLSEWSALAGEYRIRQEKDGTRVDFVHAPVQAMEPGAYRAALLYNGDPLAFYGFELTVDPTLESALRNVQLTAQTDARANPLSPTTVFTPDDTVYVVGEVDLPAGSQLRSNWYRDGRLLFDSVQQISTRDGLQARRGSFRYRPREGWEPDVYSVTLTLDGAVRWQEEFTVVEPEESAPAVAPPLTPKPLDTPGLAALTERAQLPLEFPRAAELSPDGRWLAVIENDRFQLYDAATLTPVDFPYGLAGAPAHGLAFSPDGRYLAVTTNRALSTGDTTDVQVWRLADWSLRTTLSGHANSVTALAFAPRDPSLVTGSLDTTARAWTLEDFEAPVILRHEVPGMRAAFVTDLDIDARNALLGVAIRGGVLQFWRADHDVTPGPQVSTSGGGEPQLRFVGASRRFVVTAGAKVELWRYEGEGAQRLAVLPDAEGLAVRDFDVSTDGQWLALAGAGGLRIYALETATDAPELLAAYTSPLDADGAPLAIDEVRFAAAGRTLLLLTEDGVLHFWTSGE